MTPTPPEDASVPTFSVDQIPFSCHGSWFNLSRVVGNARYADHLHLVSHQNGLHPVLELLPVTAAGEPVAAEVVATASVLSWRTATGSVEAVYDGVETIRLRGRGPAFALRAAEPTLTPFSGPFFFRDPRDGAFVYTLYETGLRYRITLLRGEVIEIAGDEELGSATRGMVLSGASDWEVAVEEYEAARPPYVGSRDFDALVADVAAEFEGFADRVAPFRGPQFPAADLAAYTVWSATVRPLGFVTRPAVLMSKHWMDKVWSWDHCFNAIALAPGHPDLAVDQLLGIFDHQDVTGALPDSVTHSERLFNFVKPPIHGWAFEQLRSHLGRALTAAELHEVYDRLSSWTGYWLDHRRATATDLPHYQHGNDSGWDNATTFAQFRVIESADLSCFLVLQLGTLARLADELGMVDDVSRWTLAAKQLRETLFDRLWHDGRFVARQPGSGVAHASRSLLDLMPVVLGGELDEATAETLAAGIRSHLAPAGLATEHPESEFYEADGYWRGPVWAPSTVLVEDGLRRAGHVELADEISAGFRALCERSGFAENFDAITGAGLRDRAYTWTASAYLLLSARAHERAVATG